MFGTCGIRGRIFHELESVQSFGTVFEGNRNLDVCSHIV